MVKAWEIASKSMSIENAVSMAATRSKHSDWETLQSLCLMYSWRLLRDTSGE